MGRTRRCMTFVTIGLTVAVTTNAVVVSTGSRQAPGGTSEVLADQVAVGDGHGDFRIEDEPGRQGLVAFTLIRGDRGDSYE
eukprot:50511-Prymnesium_polylepis.1